MAYHDILGDIIKGREKNNYNGRSLNELRKLKLTDGGFEALKLINRADIEAIEDSYLKKEKFPLGWLNKYKNNIDDVEKKRKND